MPAVHTTYSSPANVDQTGNAVASSGMPSGTATGNVIVRVKGFEGSEEMSSMGHVTLEQLPLDFKSMARASQIDNIILGIPMETEMAKKSKKNNKQEKVKGRQDVGGIDEDAQGQDTDDGVITVIDQQYINDYRDRLPEIAQARQLAVVEERQQRIDELMQKIERNTSSEATQEAFWPISQ